jgi:SsrA-binding protein
MSITENRKAFHEYFIEDRFRAGIILEGWEVKAIRAKQVSLQEAYVFFRDGAFFLLGCHISPLTQASTHVKTEATRTRKLLLNHAEIDKIHGKVQKAGYTVMPLNMHFHNGKIKLEIGLAKGKKLHDKRATEKERDTQREVQQAMRGEYNE